MKNIKDKPLFTTDLNVDGSLTPTYRKPFDLLAKGLSRSNMLPREGSNLGPIGYT